MPEEAQVNLGVNGRTHRLAVDIPRNVLPRLTPGTTPGV